ncbi:MULTISPECIES: type II toxin-antitoxin system VapC family toxin [unclassified Streptomyces]|uniref:type II toxin-antitoxin system VapC family toxin n=1 Tax=unclassified Streptomyces TaxID=2593676 RepID=UPI0011CBB6C2|nr:MULTISPECIES: PIN domain-containing protein [unclassified Streptomyces]TXS09467.1 PIN domain-containing protein [Streptomyces sp. wa22]WSQ79263.1 PIN domain-containing protein [Streptomyces sp. NBC_01213]WSQ86631.1 PIN domain-containing protein [Streptomyces sp. NBC_01212]
MIAIVDTSGLLVLYNRSDPDHLAARKAADQCGLLVANLLALTEVHQVSTVRAGRRAADGILRSLTARTGELRLVLAPPTPDILDAALTVRARYSSLDLDLVDAVNVALAAEYDTDAVLTRDLRDFRVLRPLAGRYAHFRILPDDL